jgi:histidinol-phosphate phosphatase family protein
LQYKRRAIFLDRDGTINSDEYGYIKIPQDFHLYPFTKRALAKLKKCGFLLFLVTNQSGVARGYYNFSDLDKIHNKMQQELEDFAFDDIFISPYHIQGVVKPYNISHADRKPGLGMFKQALQKYDFQIRDSYMIGDKYSDIEFGKKAGLITILVQTGNGRQEFLENRQTWKYIPDLIADNLLVAAELIEKLEKK